MDIKAYIKGRIADMQPKLTKAREMYAKTGDAGWANRVNELVGRLSELEVLLSKIERHEQR